MRLLSIPNELSLADKKNIGRVQGEVLVTLYKYSTCQGLTCRVSVITYQTESTSHNVTPDAKTFGMILLWSCVCKSSFIAVEVTS
jgi:hypothetical protein